MCGSTSLDARKQSETVFFSGRDPRQRSAPMGIWNGNGIDRPHDPGDLIFRQPTWDRECFIRGCTWATWEMQLMLVGFRKRHTDELQGWRCSILPSTRMHFHQPSGRMNGPGPGRWQLLAAGTAGPKPHMDSVAVAAQS